MQNELQNKPVKVLRCGPVKAAIWTNQRVIDDAVVEVHSIKIDKSYKEGGQWKKTTTFTAEDLPKVSVVVMEAYRFLRLRSEEPSGSLESQDTTDGLADAKDDQSHPAADSVCQPA